MTAPEAAGTDPDGSSLLGMVVEEDGRSEEPRAYRREVYVDEYVFGLMVEGNLGWRGVRLS